MRQEGKWAIAAILMMLASATGCRSAPTEAADENPVEPAFSFRPECVFDDGLVLASQDDVYSVAAHGCERISGDVTVTGEDIRGLPLAELREIHGSLQIVDTTGIEYLEGFGKLEMITGDLVIENNRDLISVRAISTLERLKGDLVIRGNEALLVAPRLYFFNGIIAEDMIIADNPKLTTLDGLGSIQEVGGTIHLENLSLSKLDGLELLRSVGGNVELADLPRLSGLSSFHSKLQIGGDLVVTGQHSYLVDCELSRLQSSENGRAFRVGGEVRIDTAATSQVVIDSDEKLQLLAGSTCTATKASIYIVGTSARDLRALSGLEDIGGDLVIRSNGELESLAGLERLRVVGGDMLVSHNPALRSADHLRRLGEVGGRLQFEQLRVLETIAGFEALTHLGRGLHIADNPALTEIDAFRLLHSIYGDIVITNNPMLSALKHIKPRSITGDLRVERNPSLSSLGSLRHTQKVLGRVSIRANGEIADDEVASLGQ